METKKGVEKKKKSILSSIAENTSIEGRLIVYALSAAISISIFYGIAKYKQTEREALSIVEKAKDKAELEKMIKIKIEELIECKNCKKNAMETLSE